LAAEGGGILTGGGIGEDGSGILVGASLDDFEPDWDLDTIPVEYEVEYIGEDTSPYLTDQEGNLMYPDGDPYLG
jgi:hypothetical protein